MNRWVQLLCVWTGVFAVVIIGIGWVPLAHIVPPPGPSASASEIVARYTEDKIGIRIGMILSGLGFALLAAPGALIAARTFPKEGRYPVLTFLQVTLVGIVMITGILFSVTMQIATFRVGEVDPTITVILNDVAWFVLLIWPAAVLWFLAIAVAVLRDASPVPALPRWAGWLTLWAAVLNALACTVPFFKNGPLAYDGIFAFYIPAGVFFVWFVAVIVALVRSINAEAALELEGTAPQQSVDADLRREVERLSAEVAAMRRAQPFTSTAGS